MTFVIIGHLHSTSGIKIWLKLEDVQCVPWASWRGVDIKLLVGGNPNWMLGPLQTSLYCWTVIKQFA